MGRNPSLGQYRSLLFSIEQLCALSGLGLHKLQDLERISVGRNRLGFPIGQESDPSCLLVLEASMDVTTVFERSALAGG